MRGFGMGKVVRWRYNSVVAYSQGKGRWGCGGSGFARLRMVGVRNLSRGCMPPLGALVVESGEAVEHVEADG